MITFGSPFRAWVPDRAFVLIIAVVYEVGEAREQIGYARMVCNGSQWLLIQTHQRVSVQWSYADFPVDNI